MSKKEEVELTKEEKEKLQEMVWGKTHKVGAYDLILFARTMNQAFSIAGLPLRTEFTDGTLIYSIKDTPDKDIKDPIEFSVTLKK